MKKIILMILKRLGSEMLLKVLDEIASTLRSRTDNSMYEDATLIKKLVSKNYVHKYMED